MKAGDLKKLLSVIPDEAEISLRIFRSGKLDAQTCLDFIAIDSDLLGINFEGYFSN